MRTVRAKSPSSLAESYPELEIFWKVHQIRQTLRHRSAEFAPKPEGASLLYNSAFISRESMRTIPGGGVSNLIQADQYSWGPLMAAALLGSVPVAILYFFFVEQYVAGLTAGTVKG